AVHPALRELPAVAPHPAGPEDAAVGVHQHDAHVGAVAVRIDHDADSNGSTLPRVTATDSATGGTERQAGAPPRLTGPRTAWKIAGSPSPPVGAATAAMAWARCNGAPCTPWLCSS